MRDLSKYKAIRTKAAGFYTQSVALQVDKAAFLKQLEDAFYFSMIMSYAQGMFLLSKASTEYKYDLKLDEIAKIWRGGCIIRSKFLENIYGAYGKNKGLEHLLLDADVVTLVRSATPGMRTVVSTAINAGIAVPAYASALSYFDNFKTASMPSNLTQAQRDYFGAHTYELIGKEGTFHTQWMPKS